MSLEFQREKAEEIVGKIASGDYPSFTDGMDALEALFNEAKAEYREEVEGAGPPTALGDAFRAEILTLIDGPKMYERTNYDPSVDAKCAYIHHSPDTRKGERREGIERRHFKGRRTDECHDGTGDGIKGSRLEYNDSQQRDYGGDEIGRRGNHGTRRSLDRRAEK